MWVGGGQMEEAEPRRRYPHNYGDSKPSSDGPLHSSIQCFKGQAHQANWLILNVQCGFALISHSFSGTVAPFSLASRTELLCIQRPPTPADALSPSGLAEKMIGGCGWRRRIRLGLES